jgi:outer membrane beta-barrel protein
MRALTPILLSLLLVASPAFAQSAEQEAGDTSEVDKADRGPLRERISPVSGQLFLKKGRFEFSPSATVSLKDAFFVKYVFGGTLTYHLTESLAISGRGGYSIPAVSGAAQICTSAATGTSNPGCHPPSWTDLDGKAPGQIRLIAGLDVEWAPIYGKIALLAERFLHFDMYGVAGASFVQYQAITEAGVPGLKPTVGGNVGVGMRFVLNRWLTVRTELRDLIYLEDFRPLRTDPYVRNQLLFELGLSLFFPTTFGES